jgi:hypothetical protein
MSFLTKYGTLWGDVPQTTGQVLWVAPSASYTLDGRSYVASDGNDGLSPERAVLTVNRSIVLATASAGDVIMMLPGTHTDSVTVTLDKAGLTFVAAHPLTRIAPNVRQNAIASKVNWTSTFAGTAVTNTAADCTFVGINMIPVTARTFMSCIATPRNTFIDCAITLSASASTSTKGVVFSGAAGAYCSFINCVFMNTIGAQGPAVDCTACVDFLMDKCTIVVTTGSWAVAVQGGAALTGIFRDNTWQCIGTAMTKGFSGTGVAAAKALLFERNIFGVSPGAAGITDMATTTFCELGTNYISTVGGGTGGTLNTTIS